jgi:hypothetical protein
LDDAMRATLGTGSTARAQVASPHELLPSNPARWIKLLLWVLGCDFLTKQVLESQRHTLGYP